MRITKRFGLTFLAAGFVSGFVLGQVLGSPEIVSAQSNDAVFELRTYTANEGKLDGVVEELRRAAPIFARHGVSNVGYWLPTDAPLSEDTLIYILKHDSREAAEKSWKDFGGDPEWREAFQELNRDGRLVASFESVFMQATDYSPIK